MIGGRCQQYNHFIGSPLLIFFFSIKFFLLFFRVKNIFRLSLIPFSSMFHNHPLDCPRCPFSLLLLLLLYYWFSPSHFPFLTLSLSLSVSLPPSLIHTIFNNFRALRLTRQSHEKDHAFAGLIALINANPAVDTSSIHSILLTLFNTSFVLIFSFHL